MQKLSRDFYLQDTIEVAKGALGKIVVRRTNDGILSGRIVETEAYLCNDPACHAHRGMTKRNQVMFGEPGHAYVYFTYGMHFCLNFVAQPHGTAEAVLIRALQPLGGIEIMRQNRYKHRDLDLCSGPGKLTQAMQIDSAMNGEDLLGDTLYVIDDGADVGEIIARPRIGLRVAVDKPWRFYPAAYKTWVSKQ